MARFAHAGATSPKTRRPNRSQAQALILRVLDRRLARFGARIGAPAGEFASRGELLPTLPLTVLMLTLLRLPPPLLLLLLLLLLAGLPLGSAAGVKLVIGSASGEPYRMLRQ